MAFNASSRWAVPVFLLLRVLAVKLERHWLATLLAAWMAAALVSFVSDGTARLHCEICETIFICDSSDLHELRVS
ncbi:MAG: hypothetical protein MUC91_05420 [Verrucomicrobia bacterium]|nr:hypothetical protein [Verrucomicrobiota bacterium]